MNKLKKNFMIIMKVLKITHKRKKILNIKKNKSLNKIKISNNKFKPKLMKNKKQSKNKRYSKNKFQKISSLYLLEYFRNIKVKIIKN